VRQRRSRADGLPAEGLSPRALRAFLRQSQRGHGAGGKLLERLDGFLGQSLAQSAVPIEPGPQGGGEAALGVEQPDRVGNRVGHQVKPRRPVRFRRPEQPFEARLKVQQYGFDVFAGAKTVDAEIYTVASELPPAHVADFDRVSEAAAGADAEVGEDRMTRVGVRDAEFLSPGACAAAVDLVFVRRAPIVRRRHGNFRRCLVRHSGDDRDRAGGVKTDLS
jgi:hypothetical protein